MLITTKIGWFILFFQFQKSKRKNIKPYRKVRIGLFDDYHWQEGRIKGLMLNFNLTRPTTSRLKQLVEENSALLAICSVYILTLALIIWRCRSSFIV